MVELEQHEVKLDKNKEALSDKEKLLKVQSFVEGMNAL